MCHHFRVLPTDERYKRLTDNQKNLLFFSWIELPSSDQIKAWHDKKAGDPVVSAEDEENFKNLGYSKEQIRRIKEQLENAGYRQ